jgi:hypothetical protein
MNRVAGAGLNEGSPGVFGWRPPTSATPQSIGDGTVGADTRIRNPGELAMAGKPRGLVVASIGVAGVMGLAAVLDLALKMPFGGQMVLDIMFILAAGLIVYMGVDCLKDMR